MRGQHVELASKNTYEKQDSRCLTIDLRCFKWVQVSSLTGNIKCFLNSSTSSGDPSMASMASARTASARAMIASSSLSLPDIICWLKVLISANSAYICSVISWASSLEFAIEAFSSWISLWVVRTFSSSSISSFSKRLSRLVFSEISALVSRVAFF